MPSISAMECILEGDSLSPPQSYYSSESSTASVVTSKTKMATSLDKLEKNFDRLEKLFFSKRRKLSISRDSTKYSANNASQNFDLSSFQALSTTSPTASQPEAAPQLFPSPSFMRPTASRMLAREEVKVTSKSPRRTLSLPENQTSPGRMPSIDESRSVASSSSLLSRRRIPKRSSSLYQRRRAPSATGSLDFSFNPGLGLTGDWSATSVSPKPLPTLNESAKRRQSPSSDRLLDALPVIPSHCPDTPPHSDNEDGFSSLIASSFIKSSPTFSAGAAITPEPSPKMPTPSRIPVPVTPGKRPRGRPLNTEARAQKHRSLEEAHEEANFGAASLRKTISDSTLSKAAPDSSHGHVPTHVEPSLYDFLSLSDDDIADDCPVTPSGKPPAFDLPPNPPVSPPITYTGSPGSKHGPLITLTSQTTGRPAAHGAYTCARICKQFNFDLVYVVNLWPAYNSTAATPRTTAPSSPSAGSHRAHVRQGSRPKMTGRILAAHGLDRVPAPFQIGENVHQNILRAKGWRKWVNEDTGPNEFSEGYAYAFYPDSGSNSNGSPTKRPRGTSQASIATTASTSSSTTYGGLDPRGIVFAAYRTPRPDGTTAPMGKAELARLYLEAEALVETLLDIHKTARARLPHGGGDNRAGAEETGPLPLQPRFSPGLSPVNRVLF